VHYPFPIHSTEAYGASPEGTLPAAERLAKEICTLSLFPTMSDDDVDRVVAAVASFESEE
jgi:dTDP-4-amino-4,6-dideoxygalactose transaminase